MSAGVGAVYLCYFPISDPLVESQVIAYLTGLAANGVRVHLITFETRSVPGDEAAIRSRLLKDGIHWSCLRYRPGGSLLRKGLEGLHGIGRLIRVVLRNDLRIIHARAHPAALMAYPVARLLGRKLLFDVRGLIADEYAETGHWSRSSLRFRAVKIAERLLLRRADALVFLTRAVVRDLTARGALSQEDGGRITVIPCCVKAPPPATDDGPRPLVLAYVGKLGSMYLQEELLRFFLAVRRLRPEARLMILTQSPVETLRTRLSELNLPAAEVSIAAVQHDEVANHLTNAAAALAFFKPGYSKIASSPTKVGEYLAAGLPLAMNAEIGDCDDLLRDGKVGVTLNDFSEAEIELAAARLVALVDRPGVREHCREVALRELDLRTIGVARYRAIYEKLGA